ncbi:phosphoribosylamine--glycine ligase-like isoform X2 [Phragmites australis]|uniref:phosphoribosylamine--glycine ligase-like isoform X2 n=1 Tax=Phragmites australis TaxID=29695 RepID=UPI002D7987A5|nr:phosphoribosylamine--glycine ligase-like isoform X2 [Phragmites australis]
MQRATAAKQTQAHHLEGNESISLSSSPISIRFASAGALELVHSAEARMMACAPPRIKVSLKFGAKAFRKNYVPGYSNSTVSFPISRALDGLSSPIRVENRAYGSNLIAGAMKSRDLNTTLSSTVGSLKVPERVTVLVIGGGGREHALCYALERSPSCDAVFCAPGNSGIAESGDATCIPDLDITKSDAVISFCRNWGVGLVVVGPEAPLVAGLANDLVKAGIPTFGPSSEAAALEGSKDFMKKLCDKYNIPTAKYQTFTNPADAKQYVKDQGAPIVVKADGLAAGKGVVVAMTLDEAFEAIDTMLVEGSFGSAGSRVIIEEFLEGEEASFFALVDGETALPLESAQDHKRVGDGDVGPNTGGMGAYSPAPIVTEELKQKVMESIILPTVKGMAAEGCKFVGVLYAGLMIEKKSGLPKLIEYNVRFGDPECQVLMMRLESDLAEVLLAACRGELGKISLTWSPELATVVVMASEGYPGAYKKGTVIKNLDEAEQVSPAVKIFHAGTTFDRDGNFVAAGGRVLGVTAKGKDIEEARAKAYDALDVVDWPEGFYRHDIGWRAIKHRHMAAH